MLRLNLPAALGSIVRDPSNVDGEEACRIYSFEWIFPASAEIRRSGHVSVLPAISGGKECVELSRSCLYIQL